MSVLLPRLPETKSRTREFLETRAGVAADQFRHNRLLAPVAHHGRLALASGALRRPGLVRRDVGRVLPGLKRFFSRQAKGPSLLFVGTRNILRERGEVEV